MAGQNRSDLPTLPDVDPRLLNKLDFSVLLLLLLVIVFRTMSAGQDPHSATTAFCEIITFCAASLWCLRKLAGKVFSIPSRKIFVPVIFFLIAIAISTLRANHGGNIVEARLLAMHWAAEILLFFIILDYVVTRERYAVLVCGLLAAAAILIAYGLYQRAYGLQYFIEYVTAQPDLADKMAGPDPVFQGIFRGRLETPQIYGPYGYANAMAGFLILGLPLLWYTALSTWISSQAPGSWWPKKIFLALLAIGGMVALVLTGSRGGLLAAKAAEVIAFLALGCNKNYRRKGIWAEILSAEIIFSLAAMSLVAPLLFTEQAGWLGQVLFGILWSGVIALVAYLCLRPQPSPRAKLFKVFGAITAALILAGIIWIAGGAPGGSQSLHSQLAEQKLAFQEGRNTPAVRWNYWRSGWDMWMQNFWLGVGLDQFSTHYTAYKPIEGWAVKRAHNNYLQMAADGGVLLLGAWLLLCILFFLSRLRNDPLPPEKSLDNAGGIKISERRMLVFGSMTVLSALVLMAFPDPFRILNLRMPLFFEGLSIEFFWNEFLGGVISQWPTNHLPGLIHLGTHIILLPLVGIGVFCLSWQTINNAKNFRLVWQMLRLGVLAMLLHALVEFVYYMQVISSTIWVMAALALTQTTAGAQFKRIKIINKKYTALLIPVAIVGLSIAIWLWPIAHWEQSQIISAADYLYQYGEDSEATEQAIELYQQAVKKTPRDPLLHHRLSELYLRQFMQKNLASANLKADWLISPMHEELREQALKHARLTVECQSSYAASHAFLGKTLTRLYPSPRLYPTVSREPMEEARSAFEKAWRLHPYRPEYFYWLGVIEERLGNITSAEVIWRIAFELDNTPKLSDARAHLDKETRNDLENRLDIKPEESPE